MLISGFPFSAISPAQSLTHATARVVLEVILFNETEEVADIFGGMVGRILKMTPKIPVLRLVHQTRGSAVKGICRINESPKVMSGVFSSWCQKRKCGEDLMYHQAEAEVAM